MPKEVYKHKSFSEEHKRKLSEAHKGEKHPFYGKHHSEETKRKMSEVKKRERNPSWKGGLTTDINGYLHFKVPKGCRFSSMKNKHGYILLHRLMMAEYLQRPLRPEEVVHHKNEDITDNRIENFKLLKNKSEHTKLHRI